MPSRTGTGDAKEGDSSRVALHCLPDRGAGIHVTP